MPLYLSNFILFFSSVNCQFLSIYLFSHTERCIHSQCLSWDVVFKTFTPVSNTSKCSSVFRSRCSWAHWSVWHPPSQLLPSVYSASRGYPDLSWTWHSCCPRLCADGAHIKLQSLVCIVFSRPNLALHLFFFLLLVFWGCCSCQDTVYQNSSCFKGRKHLYSCFAWHWPYVSEPRNRVWGERWKVFLTTFKKGGLLLFYIMTRKSYQLFRRVSSALMVLKILSKFWQQSDSVPKFVAS